MKLTAKFRASRGLRFEDTKTIVTRNVPERFATFEKQAPENCDYYSFSLP